MDSYTRYSKHGSLWATVLDIASLIPLWVAVLDVASLIPLCCTRLWQPPYPYGLLD